MNKKILFILFAFVSTSLAFSQNAVVDSLVALLNSSREDTIRAHLLNELCREHMIAGEYAKALEFGNKVIELSEKKQTNSRVQKNINTAVANACNNMGIIYYHRSNYSLSLQYYLKAVGIYEQDGNKKRMASCYNNIGNVYKDEHDNEHALEFYFKSLKLKEELGDKKAMAASYNNIGLIYKNQSSYSLALENLLKGLRIEESEGNKQGVAESYNNIGFLYEEIYEADETKVRSAFPQWQKFPVEKIRTAILDSVWHYQTKALAISKELEDHFGMAYCYGGLGYTSLHRGQLKQAIDLYEKASVICDSLNMKYELSHMYSGIAQAYEKLGDYMQAYKYHLLYAVVKDSVFNEESSKQIAEMQTKYETEKKEQQITLLNKDEELQDAQLNRQKIIIWSVAGGLLVVLILSIFIFRERRKSEKLLLNILPAETARELKAHGKAKAKHYEQVTVMFTDFKGFTTIAEKLSAEELVSELDFLFKMFDKIISYYPIEKIKTIGDAYMCAGGLPTANATNAMDVVSAAIEIQEWMIAQNSKWNLRIGIHSGPVTAGVVGDKKFSYDIWGDTVNTASRMESSGEAGKINISGTTYELIKEQFRCEFRGKIPAKNKGEIDMYFVEKT